MACGLQVNAALIGCGPGEEFTTTLDIAADPTGFCLSGFKARDVSWNNWHCVHNQSSSNLQPGEFKACFQYQDLGNGTGVVFLKTIEDASLR
jgi:hypothetical protein